MMKKTPYILTSNTKRKNNVNKILQTRYANEQFNQLKKIVHKTRTSHR